MINLTKAQKDYIEQNIDKKSIRQMAKELRIDKKTLHKYIKSLQKKDVALNKNNNLPIPEKTAIKIPETRLVILQVISIFTVAFLIRLVYLYQLNHTYFFIPFKGGFDEYVFDNWA
jgi:hypothetical protein